MKKLIILCVAALSLTTLSCSRKAYQGDVEVKVPCQSKEVRGNKTSLRALGEGYSSSQSIARDNALVKARGRLAASLQTLVKSVSDNFLSSYTNEIGDKSRERFLSLTRQVVKTNMRGSKITCDKLMRTPEGKFRCYILLEIKADDILNSYETNINQDEQLRTDFEYEKFKKAFNEEFQKFKTNE